MCHKVKHLLLKDNLKLYKEQFTNKSIDHEYHVDASAEVEVRAKFLKPFDDHKLLKFIGLIKKYNHDYVKAFYYNLVRTLSGIESMFKDKVIRFHYTNFSKYLGLTSFYLNVTGTKHTEYDIVCFVLSISKYVV